MTSNEDSVNSVISVTVLINLLTALEAKDILSKNEISLILDESKKYLSGATSEKAKEAISVIEEIKQNFI